MTQNISAVLHELEQEYVARTPNSRAIVERASEVMPNGETRSVLRFSPYPLVIKSGKGSELVDVDGNKYLDFINDYGAGLYGHSQPKIQSAIREAIEQGLTLGGVNQYEGELARLLVDRFPALDKVRFTNSGTEANLMAITTARLVTGKDKIAVIRGGYHGSVLTMSTENSRSLAPYSFVFLTYNDLENAEQVISTCGDDLAAILVEPMVGTAGMLPATKKYLAGLREIADRTKAILIFDEVITSRIGPEGCQGEYGVIPDLMSCGKYLGGGGTFGAFGGRSDLMDIYNADRPYPAMHGGTFNNNIITMAAGVAGLSEIFTKKAASDLLDKGNTFRDELNHICARTGVEMQVRGMGPGLGFHFHNHNISSPEQVIALANPKVLALFHMAMLERGIYLARRGGVLLSVVNTAEDFSAFYKAFTDVLEQYGGLFNEVSPTLSERM